MFSPSAIFATAVITLGLFLLGVSFGRRSGMGFVLASFCSLSVIALGFLKFALEIQQTADATYYYDSSLRDPSLNFGTQFVSWFTSIFTSILSMGFLPTMLTFSVFPLIAVPYFYATYQRTGGCILGRLWAAAFFAIVLPSAGFWGGGISKDGIALLSIALFCWALTKSSRRAGQLIASVALMMLVRPHIGLLMAFATAFGVVASRDAKVSERVVIGAGGVAAIVLLTPVIFAYFGIAEGASLGKIIGGAEEQSSRFSTSNAYVNIAEMSPPLRIFTYLFRPLPYEAQSLPQLVAATQNVVLLFLLGAFAFGLFHRDAQWRSSRQLTLLSFAIVGVMLSGMTTANLGIATRQKWMVVLPLLFAFQSAWAMKRYMRSRPKKNHVVRAPVPDEDQERGTVQGDRAELSS